HPEHRPQRPPQAPAAEGGAAENDPFRGLSPSQKRRLRRRRRQQMRRDGATPGEAPVASPNDTIEAMKAEIAREKAEEDPRREEVSETAAAVPAPEAPAPFDQDADEELLEAREVLEHAGDGEREDESAPPATETAAEAAADRPSRDDRRRGRDRDRR